MRSRKTWISSLFVLTLLSPVVGRAQLLGLTYIAGSSEQLESINPLTGTFTQVLTIGIGTGDVVSGLSAFDSVGHRYFFYVETCCSKNGKTG